MTEENKTSLPENIIFFDGVCNLCNRSIQYIIRNDPEKHFFFAPLQSEIAKKILPQKFMGKEYDSVILYTPGNIYVKSSAALRVAKKLRGMNKLLWLLIIIPRPLRDFIYDLIAKNRYKWFGKREECMVPTQDVKSRFL